MKTMTTEELAEEIFAEFWTGMAPDWSERVRDRGEKVRRIKDLLGEGKFVQSDQDFWIVTEEDLREIVDKGALYGDVWNNAQEEQIKQWDGIKVSRSFWQQFGNLIKNITNGEIQSLDDLEEDEEKGFEPGDLVVNYIEMEYGLVNHNESNDPGLYADQGTNNVYWNKENLEKVGYFRPTQEALEEVPEWTKGEVVIDDQGGMGLWTGHNLDKQDRIKYLDEEGKLVSVPERSIQHTKIIIDFHDCPTRK